MARIDEEFRKAGPGENAEEFFKDDPEMLALVAAARKDQAGPNPRRKPWWWAALVTVLTLGGGAAGCLPAAVNLLDLGIQVPFHVVLPVTFAVASGLLGVAILGHRMGSFIIRDDKGRELERATLWTPLSLLGRLGALAAAIALPCLGIALTAAFWYL